MLTLTFPLVFLANLNGFIGHVVPDHHHDHGDKSPVSPCVDSTGIHSHGESWLCEDGCNICSCVNGLISSTEKACQKSCEDSTGTHFDGETWECADGCNKCFCRNGLISSTEKACSKSCKDAIGTHLEGESWLCADGCNNCFCRNGLISSTRMLCTSTQSPSDCVCTREFVPVCGKDGKQYGNKCLALCNNTTSQCEEGSCPCPKKKGDKKMDTKKIDYKKVDNKKESNKKRWSIMKGDNRREPSCTCPAPDIKDPVCGVNGRTYRNRCHAYCDGIDVDCEGECICIRSA